MTLFLTSGLPVQFGIGGNLKTHALQYNSPCAYGGEKLNSDNIEIDHIVPRFRQGVSNISNYAVVCHDCNQEKADRPLSRFRQSRPAFDDHIVRYLNLMNGYQFGRTDYLDVVIPTIAKEAKMNEAELRKLTGKQLLISA